MLVGGFMALYDSGIPRRARNARALGRLGGVVLFGFSYFALAGSVIGHRYQGAYGWLIAIPYLCLLCGELYARITSERIIEASGIRLVRLSSKQTADLENRNQVLDKAGYGPFISSFAGDRGTMARDDAKRAYDEFVAAIPKRVQALQALADRVAGKPLSREVSPVCFAETAAVISTLFRDRDPSAIPTSDLDQPDLDGQSLALCIDLGMMLGETLILRNPSLHWALNAKKKGDPNYQHPVVTSGKALGDVRPAAVVKGIAFRILRGEKAAEVAQTTFDVWERTLLGVTPVRDSLGLSLKD